MTRSFHSFLDGSRWGAAFLVVIHHVRHLFLTDLGNVQHPNLVIKAIYLVTGFGHEAVVIFFVISGYLVGGHTWDTWRREGAAPLDYVAARTARIYTVLVPALALSLLLDQAGSYWFDASRLYSNPGVYHTISLFGVVSDRLSATTVLGNLLLLQNIAVPVLGSNGPLWSLAYEWWYYIIFFIAAMGMLGSTAARKIICCAALALLAWLLPASMLLMGTLWMIGFLLFFAVRSAPRLPHPMLGIAVFVAALMVSRLTHNVDNTDHPESILVTVGRDGIVAVGYAFLACGIARSQATPRFAALHKAMADFSYSTYLVHFPMMVFAAAVLNQVFGLPIVQQPTFASLAALLCMSAFLYVYAYAFAALTERHTAGIRQWLRDKALWTSSWAT